MGAGLISMMPALHGAHGPVSATKRQVCDGRRHGSVKVQTADQIGVCRWSLQAAGPDDLAQKVNALGLKRVQLGEDPQQVLDDLGLRRYCCRRMIVAHADLIDEVIPLG